MARVDADPLSLAERGLSSVEMPSICLTSMGPSHAMLLRSVRGAYIKVLYPKKKTVAVQSIPFAGLTSWEGSYSEG